MRQAEPAHAARPVRQRAHRSGWTCLAPSPRSSLGHQFRRHPPHFPTDGEQVPLQPRGQVTADFVSRPQTCAKLAAPSSTRHRDRLWWLLTCERCRQRERAIIRALGRWHHGREGLVEVPAGAHRVRRCSRGFRRTDCLREGGPGVLGRCRWPYRLVSYKLEDVGLIDRVEMNGVVTDLDDNAWSYVNGLAPGVFGVPLTPRACPSAKCDRTRSNVTGSIIAATTTTPPSVDSLSVLAMRIARSVELAPATAQTPSPLSEMAVSRRR